MTTAALKQDRPMPEGRRLLLDCAARLFRQHGYAAVSIRDIAAASGFKAGSLYYHFASKEEIVAEVLDLGVDAVFDEVSRCVAALPGNAPFAHRLREAIRAHLHTLLERDDYTGANIRIFGHVPPRVRQGALARRQVYEAWWRDLLAQGRAEHAIRPETDLRLLQLFMLGAMNWSLEWHRPAPADPDDVNRLAHQLADIVLHGAAVPEAPRRAVRRPRVREAGS